MTAPPHERRKAWLIFLGYLAFVVYGSLVPFEYRAVSLDEAFKQFAGITYLQLGIGSRADWVANILLYAPLSFLACASVIGLRVPGVLRLLAVLPVLAFCLAVAAGVEFVQIFFAPRTVSLNDLLAETLGSIGGIALFLQGRWRLAGLLDAYRAGGRPSVVAVATLYGLAYLMLSLFPYDFLVDPDELAWKLEFGNQGWLLAGDCGGWLRCGARQLSEAAAIAPLGVLTALAARSLDYRRVFLAGAALGFVLELLQILLASGVSQGLSLLWRGAGLASGYSAGKTLRRLGVVPVARILRRILPFAVPPYLLALLALNGGFSSSWLSSEEALGRLDDLRLMPFYYHYYTTETTAMVSLLAQAGIYAPVGLAVWAWRMERRQGGLLYASGAAFLLALSVEFGKLWLAVGHPDFTNALIAAVAAAGALALANWLARVLREDGMGVPMRMPAPPPAAEAIPPRSLCWHPSSSPHPWGLLVGLFATLCLLLGVFAYPVGKPWLLLGLGAYGTMLWRRPEWLFFALPALLPVLDLSPITGVVWLDEFDLIVLLTLAVSYHRFYGGKPVPWPTRWLALAFILSWVSWGVTSMRGLWPLLDAVWPIADSSHSPLEAWRVGKGLLWALLLVPIVRRVPSELVPTAARLWINGSIVALVLVALVILWERLAFVGLSDFDNVFRVTGPFASMNTGGAYIETFIAFAFPLLLVWVLRARGWLRAAFGIVAAALASYAMMVTFARVGYAAMLAGVVPVVLALWRGRTLASGARWLLCAGLMAVVVGVAVPVLSGGFAQSRLTRASGDMSVRLAHWQRALGLMDEGIIAASSGMGFGQYPLLYLLRAHTEKPPGTYAVLLDGDNHYLSLGAGESVFLDQIVSIEPGTRYTLSLRIRQPRGEPALSVALCAKALLYSFDCAWQHVRPQEPARQWQTLSISLDTNALKDRGGLFRPIKLSLQNPGTGTAIELDDVSLRSEDGRERLANGGFERGVARWLFVADQDLAWHIHQQTVEVYVAQGVLGLLALALTYLGAARVLWPELRAGNLFASGFSGALLAFFVVGLLGSNLDNARLSMLFYFSALSSGILIAKSDVLSE